MHTHLLQFKTLLLLLLCTVAGLGAQAQTTLFYESFDKISGTGGNDGKWSGNVASGSLDFSSDPTDNTGWTGQNSYKADHCLKVGTGSKQGTITTPALTKLNGNATLTFEAGAWDNDNEALTLVVSITGGGELDNSNIELKRGTFTTYTLHITGGTSQSQIIFAASQKKKNRFFLDEVKVTSEATTADTDLRTTTNEGYGTYYARQSFVMPEGLTGAIVTNAKATGSEGGVLTIVDKFKAGDAVPAGTALLLKGEENTTEGKTYHADLYNGEVAPLTETNYLHGLDVVDANNNITLGDDYKYYILDYNQQGQNLGFYYYNEDGSAMTYTSPYAFLALPTTLDAAHIKGFAFDPHTTGITTVAGTTANGPATIYTLTGRRLNATSVNGLSRGIYIVNGKKVLVK